MKITIDTKEDSPEDIRKLIKMLLALIGEGYGGSEHTPPAEGAQLFDMFGSPTASTSEQQQMANNEGMDVNEFIDKPGGSGSDDDVKVVPY